MVGKPVGATTCHCKRSYIYKIYIQSVYLLVDTFSIYLWILLITK